jgi:branched-chain amino acid aminotransferase
LVRRPATAHKQWHTAKLERFYVTPIAYINGSFLPEPEAMVGVDDGGWLHGAGLFETMRAEHGRVFRLGSHLDRLRRSAERVLRPIGWTELPNEQAFCELLRRNQLNEARIRLTVTAGSMRSTEGTDAVPPLTVCISAAPLSNYPAKLYETGVAVILSPYHVSPTDPIAGHKTTSYLPRLLGLRHAQSLGCMEALWFTTRNELAEGSISNVFVVSRGVLKTPPTETPVLPGIARGVVLENARRLGIEAAETPLTIHDLLDADEVFVTNSIMQILPVVRVERHDIGEGRVGAMTTRLLNAYRELVRQECTL